MRRLTPKRIPTVAFLASIAWFATHLATAALAQSTPKDFGSETPQSLAKLTLVDRSELSTRAVANPARAPRLAGNEKLAEATCSSLTVTTGAVGALVFDDGFENGLDSWQSSGARFSPRGALDLKFSAQLQGLRGEALLRVELTSPSGHAFQTLEAPVVVSSGIAAPQFRAVDGYPFPVPVRFAVPGGGPDMQTVSMIWPLAGTHVVSHGLYGEWTVSASLVDASTQLGGSSVACPDAQFSIQP